MASILYLNTDGILRVELSDTEDHTAFGSAMDELGWYSIYCYYGKQDLIDFKPCC